MKGYLAKKELRLFGLIIGVVIPFVLRWIIPLLGVFRLNTWAIIVLSHSIILCLIFSKFLSYHYKLCLEIIFIANYSITFIIFSLIFIGVITPISFLMKLFKYDPLRQIKSKNITYKKYRKNKQMNLNRTC